MEERSAVSTRMVYPREGFGDSSPSLAASLREASRLDRMTFQGGPRNSMSLITLVILPLKGCCAKNPHDDSGRRSPRVGRRFASPLGED